MADPDRLMKALRAAHAAGDTEAAKRIAKMIKAQSAPDMPSGPKSPELAGGLAYMSSLTKNAAFPEAPAPEDQGAFGAFMGNLAPGMTLGFADEIAAGIGSLFEDRSYDEILAGLRAQQDRQQELHPIASIAGQVVGGVAPGALGAKAIAAGTTLPGKIWAGAKSGAVLGAAQGFGDGEGGLTNRLASSGISALLGGGLGAAVPVVAQVGKSAVRSGADALRNSRIAKNIGGTLGISPEAARVVGGIVGSDDVTSMRKALAASGDDAMLADASPALGVTADSAMRSPVSGARVAFDRIEARAGQAYDDLLKAINPKGAVKAVGQAMDDARTGSAAARKAAYDAAYSQPIDYASAEGAFLLDTVMPRLPGKAIGYANEMMKLRGEKSAQIMAKIADDGTVTFIRPPDVRQWDYIKQALQQLAESGDGAGALGGQTRLGAAYASLATDIRDAVAGAVPEYKVALGVASDAISERNAVKFGADLLSPKVTTYDALNGIKGASPAELDAMKTGVIGQIDEVLGNVRAVASDQNIDARQATAAFKALSSPNAQKKMEALFGADWPAIKEQLGKAGAALGLRARTAANSATAGRAMADRAVVEATTPSALRSGKPLEALKNFAGGITGASPEAVARLRDDVKGEIADLLTRQGGSAANALDVILASLGANPINPRLGQGTYNALSGLGFAAVPTAATAPQNWLGPR